jgi:tetratricopeptide (TPR) repeat protein
LEEGVREYSKFEKAPNLERWMYLSFLATIYETARNFQKAQEVRMLAVEEKTDSSALFIDLAYGSVRGLNRPAEAREFLAKAEKLEITGVGKAYLPFVRGIICWRERRMEEAKGLFEKAIKGFEPWMHNALTEGLILLSQSYLCAVHGALGNVREAKALFGRTEKFLIAKREDEILKACREGLNRIGTAN